MGFGNLEQKENKDLQKDLVKKENLSPISKYSPEIQEHINELSKKNPDIHNSVICGLRDEKKNIEEKFSNNTVLSEKDYAEKIDNFFSKITNRIQEVNKTNQQKFINIYNTNDVKTIENVKTEFKKSLIKETGTEIIDNKKEITENKKEFKNEAKNAIEEQKKLYEKGINDLMPTFNGLTVTKSKVNFFFTQQNKLKKEDLDWFKQRNEIFDKEILAKDEALQKLSKEDLNKFKKIWLANERINDFGETTKYKDQKALQDNFMIFEKKVGHTFNYKSVTEKGYQSITVTETTIFTEGTTSETKRANTLDDFQNNPGSIVDEESGEKFLPSSETDNIFTDKDLENGDIMNLENAKKIVKEKIKTKLKESKNISDEFKKEEYFTETGDIDKTKTEDIGDKKVINELENIGKEAQEETIKEFSTKMTESLNKIAHKSIINADINQIGKYFSKDNLGSSIKLENLSFEEKQMRMEIKVPFGNQENQKEYPAKIRHNVDGRLFINNPIDFSEAGKCKLGTNNGGEVELPIISPSIDTMKGKIKGLALGDLLKGAKNMEEYEQIVQEEMSRKLENSFTYSLTNQLYVQREIEKNNMIQNTTNKVSSLLFRSKMLDINNPDIIDKKSELKEGDPKYSFLKLLSDTGNNYASKSQMEECSNELEELTYNIKNKMIDEKNIEGKYTADETLAKYVFNKENFSNDNIGTLVDFLNIFTKDIPGENKKTNNTKMLDITALKNINKAFTTNEKITSVLQRNGSEIYIEKYNNFCSNIGKTHETETAYNELMENYGKEEDKFPPHLIA